MGEQSEKEVKKEKKKTGSDEYTQKLLDDYFLILKDGRIVGSRLSAGEGPSVLIFQVMGINCDTADGAGSSYAFSPIGLDYDLYMTAEELTSIMETVPDQKQVLTALPIFKNEEISSQEIIAFYASEKVEGEDKHLLWIYAPYLLTLFGDSMKAEAQKLRNYKFHRCGIGKPVYDYPDENDKEYYGGILGGINFFDLVEQKNKFQGLPPPGDWISLLMCNVCGKLYLERNSRPECGVECPVCLERYPEEGKYSVEDSWLTPWFQTFIPEYPLDKKERLPESEVDKYLMMLFEEEKQQGRRIAENMGQKITNDEIKKQLLEENHQLSEEQIERVKQRLEHTEAFLQVLETWISREIDSNKELQKLDFFEFGNYFKLDRKLQMQMYPQMIYTGKLKRIQ